MEGLVIALSVFITRYVIKRVRRLISFGNEIDAKLARLPLVRYQSLGLDL